MVTGLCQSITGRLQRPQLPVGPPRRERQQLADASSRQVSRKQPRHHQQQKRPRTPPGTPPPTHSSLPPPSTALPVSQQGCTLITGGARGTNLSSASEPSIKEQRSKEGDANDKRPSPTSTTPALSSSASPRPLNPKAASFVPGQPYVAGDHLLDMEEELGNDANTTGLQSHQTTTHAAPPAPPGSVADASGGGVDAMEEG
jgi:hypothetical protein